MARYKDRPLDLGILVPRFESGPSWMHARNARGLLERLAEEGKNLFGRDSAQTRRWQDGWNAIRQHVWRLGQDSDMDLATALREFIQAFEHETRRMEQMLFGLGDRADTGSGTGMNASQLRSWTDLAFRASIYAITSSYIPDKQETNSLVTRIDVMTGEVTQEGERFEAKVPRKYRNATKEI